MTEQPIFFIPPGEASKAVVLQSHPYDKEEILQSLLADHPDVLAGGTTEGDGTGKLLLVRREIGIPTAEGASDTFSLDHLFIDTHGIPVIVEVKRSSDTRIRREVVGQMLDYAANGTRYWPISKLRESLDELERKHRVPGADGSSPGDQAVAEFIDGSDVEEFWSTIEENLRRGNVRMVFVADQLPTELVRIIEFLNEQMKPAEVLGVEVVQYLGANGLRVLVPHLVGATSAAAAAKNPAPRTTWNRASFLEEANQWKTPEVVDLFSRLFDHVEEHQGRLSWGKGMTPGLSGWYMVDGVSRPVWLATLGPNGLSDHPTITFWFEVLGMVPTRVDSAVECLSRIEDFRPAIEAARNAGFKGKGSYPKILLDELVASAEDTATLFDAIEAIADPVGAAQVDQIHEEVE